MNTDRVGSLLDTPRYSIGRRKQAEDVIVLGLLDAVESNAAVTVGAFDRVADQLRVTVLLHLLGREVMALLPNESITAG